MPPSPTMPLSHAAAPASAAGNSTATASDPTPPPPVPKPVPASTLLTNLLRQQRRHQQHRNSHGYGLPVGIGAEAEAEAERMDKVRSGFSELDDYVFMGGVERGVVMGVSGDGDLDSARGGVGRLLSLHLLATVLLSTPLAKASIIDTTGSFPVSLLAKVIRLRTMSQVGRTGRRVEKLKMKQALDEQVEELLGRVAISRAFDIEGVWEVLSEISADCQSHITVRDHFNLVEETEDDPDRRPRQVTAAARTAGTKLPRGKVAAEREEELEIGDSEAEEGDNDLDDIEEGNVPHFGDADHAQHKTNAQASIFAPLLREDPTLGLKSSDHKGRTEIIIIDNMTWPINELFSNRDRASAHTLLSTFSRTLHTLSQTHNILTILLNTLKSPYPSHPKPGHPSASRLPIPTKPISIFSTTISRPALGRLFSDLCAFHLLITHVPKTAKDAKALYTSPPNLDDTEEPHTPLPDPSLSQNHTPSRDIEYAFVIEVLKDTTPDLDFWLQQQDSLPDLSNNPRTHLRSQLHIHSREREHKCNRTQRWAPFVLSTDALSLHNAFGPSPAGKQMSGLGQMHVVKQFPFGRRV